GFDIDRKILEGLNREDQLDWTAIANVKRDGVLGDVWRAFGFSAERQPIILLSPGCGYHVYLPLDRLWPVAFARQFVEHRLHPTRLALKDGTLELFPCGKALRAPCGRGTRLLVPKNPDDPDNLELEATPFGWRAPRGDYSHVQQYVGAFLERFQAARRP